MTMSEGALPKDFDLVRGKWRINASLPGYKVVGCAVEDLRRRLFPLRQVEASEFAKQVPFDEKGEPIQPPVMLHGMPTWYYYYGNTVYIYPPPLHAWRLMLTYEPRDELTGVLTRITGTHRHARHNRCVARCPCRDTGHPYRGVSRLSRGTRRTCPGMSLLSRPSHGSQTFSS
jgi:hypothetical protein